MTTTALRAGVVLVLVVALGAGAAASKATGDATNSLNTDVSISLNKDVSISPSRTMHLECEGRGGPTVVLIAGGNNSGAIWSMPFDFDRPGPTVFPEVAKFSRVCAYDRPGTASPGPNEQIVAGSSTPVPQPVTEANGAVDLHDLLEAADVPGPYVLVAHSYGGLIARLYASTYPDDVAGFVLIDTTTEYLYDRLTKAQQEEFIANNSSPPVIANGEQLNFPALFAEMRAARSAPHVPSVVLVQDKGFGDTEFAKLSFRAHRLAQKQLAKVLDAKLVTKTDSGHYIFVEHPELVIEEIRQVVNEARTKR
jgi:pimeloyl-ACP methyl ester carboxylesterase